MSRITISEEQIQSFEELGYTVFKTYEVEIPERLPESRDDCASAPIKRNHTRKVVSTYARVTLGDIDEASIPENGLRQFFKEMKSALAWTPGMETTRGSLNLIMRPIFPELSEKSISANISKIINHGGLIEVSGKPTALSVG